MLIGFDKTKSECKAAVIYLAIWAVRPVRPIVQQGKGTVQTFKQEVRVIQINKSCPQTAEYQQTHDIT